MEAPLSRTGNRAGGGGVAVHDKVKGKPISTRGGYLWSIRKKLSNKHIGKSRTQKRIFKAKI